MDIPQVTTVELHGASSTARRRPPKLKSVDRTVSMIVDNYTPLTSAALSAKNAGPLVINMDAPAMRSSPNINEQHHLYKTHSQSSSNSMDGAVGGASSHSMEMEYQTSSLRKSSSFRRGETIDLPSETSTSLTHLRKTPSFHSSSGEDSVKIVQLNRYHSVRHHPTTYPTTFKSHHQQQQQQQQQQLQPSNESSHNLSTRRNCSMHRSFHEPSPSQKRAILRRDAVNKSNSFNNDEQQQQLQQQQQSHSMHQQLASFQQQQQRKHSSLEGELYRSRSNSRNNKQSLEEPLQYLEVRKPSPLPSPTMYHARSPNLSPRPSSATSIDQMLLASQAPSSPRPSTSGASSKSHITRQHTIGSINPQFLAPIPLLALDKSFEDIYQVKSPVFDTKKSYSLRYKNVADRNSKDNRELFKARKSKSFISDIDPEHEFPYTLGISPSLSPGLSNSGSIKKHHSPLISPSPQIRGNIIMDDIKRGSDASDIIPPPVNFPIEFGTIDFNTIYKSYREQKQSTSSSRRHKHRRKKSSLTNSKLDDDFDSESNKKRKRIVCIVMTVFLSLVLFSILAVIVTLTHFSVAQVQNQTRNVYTFSRDSPIHYTGGGGN